MLYIKNTLHGYAQRSSDYIFEYVCDKCGKFESLRCLQSQTSRGVPPGSDVKKLMSTRMGIVFKGSGFYCTDNRPAKLRWRFFERLSNIKRPNDCQTLFAV